MIRTIQDVAAAEDFKSALRKLIEDPVMQTALLVLERENAPSFKVNMAPGMDAMQCVALHHATLCGAHALIKQLVSLPNMTNRSVDRSKMMGNPWEYLANKDEPEVEAQ